MILHKLKTPLILLGCVIGIAIYTNYEEGVNSKKLEYIDIVKNEVKDDNIIDKNSINSKKVPISAEAQYLVDKLTPFSNEELEGTWESEFGCYSSKAKEMQEYDDSICSNLYLTAKSYDEALWMQRNGYPSSSQLKLLEDKENLRYLSELANKNKYTPAMALLTIHGLNTQQYKEASNMALNLRAYSENHKTFPHRIRGESLIAFGNIEFGLSSLKVSSLLGDVQAKYVFNRYLTEYPDLGVSTTDLAYLYMGRTFGVPPDQFPEDPRPTGSGG